MPEVTRAAGIMFIAPDSTALFLKRGPGGDCPGVWCFPGGHLEDGETTEQAAVREAKEELGFLPDGERRLLTRTISNREAAGAVGQEINPPPNSDATVLPTQVDFTTFVQPVAEQFVPKLDGEHVGWAWAPVSQPPEPLHPGCCIALARLDMDELGVARAMAAGDLCSPQRYMNMTLFDIRITGTGSAHRGEIKDEKTKKVLRAEEFVWRDPSIYLNDEFLARCNGLPVIWVHPKKNMLDSKEFERRIVGTVFLPYIKGEEVWAVAKIYDDGAIEAMMSEQLSTSPGVILRKAGNPRVIFEGRPLLIEGVPMLVDHLAIVEQGVWDKGNDPAGVSLAEEIETIADSAISPVALERALIRTGAMTLDGCLRRIAS